MPSRAASRAAASRCGRPIGVPSLLRGDEANGHELQHEHEARHELELALDLDEVESLLFATLARVGNGTACEDVVFLLFRRFHTHPLR